MQVLQRMQRAQRMQTLQRMEKVAEMQRLQKGPLKRKKVAVPRKKKCKGRKESKE